IHNSRIRQLEAVKGGRSDGRCLAQNAIGKVLKTWLRRYAAIGKLGIVLDFKESAIGDRASTHSDDVADAREDYFALIEQFSGIEPLIGLAGDFHGPSRSEGEIGREIATRPLEKPWTIDRARAVQCPGDELQNTTGDDALRAFQS